MIKQKIKPFNGEMNLLKMIGIVHVVVGHIYSQIFSILRQPYTFHMPLFYFISGYFYDENHEKEKGKYIWSKFKKSVVLFYFYLFFMIIFCSLISWKYNISLGTISFYDLIIKPFTFGIDNPGFLMGPTWFILSLFLVQTVFIFIYPLIKKIFKNDLHKLIFFLLLGIMSIYLSNRGWNSNGYLLIILRTIAGMMFYYFGYFYKRNIENKINIFNGKTLIFSLILMSILVNTNINLLFGFNTMSFNGQTLLPIITSIIGIYISIFIAKGLNKIIKNENDILHIIGRNSLYIMIFHLPIFFIISLLLFKINNISEYYYSSLAVFPFCPGFINRNNFWPLYVSLGLLLPTLYGEIIRRIKK